jgi:tRNA(Ile)-lysidine synthase
VYKRCLDKLGTGQALLEGLERLDAVWLRNEGGKTIQFPGSKTATITGGNILFSRG